MTEKEFGETPGQTLKAKKTPGGPFDGFVGDLARCLGNVVDGGNIMTQLEVSKPLLEKFLNKYFTVDENGHLKMENGLIEHGVSILKDGDRSFYFEVTPHILSMYGNTEGLNLRRGFYIFYDYDNFKSPVYRVYEAQRSISEDPNSEQKPEIEQGNVLRKLIGRIEYRKDKKKKFKRS